jgi:hypothetical protein
MRRLNDLIIRWSRRWWPLLAAAVAGLVSFQLLVLIGERFAAVTGGYQPFDLQNPLSLQAMQEQLPRYTAASRTLYWIFIAADMVFPVAAALPLALLLAKALRGIDRVWAASALRRGVALMPFLVAVLDWIENGFFVATVALHPREITTWATLALAMKTTKVGLLLLLNPMIAGLALGAMIAWLAARRTSPDPGQERRTMRPDP